MICKIKKENSGKYRNIGLLLCTSDQELDKIFAEPGLHTKPVQYLIIGVSFLPEILYAVKYLWFDLIVFIDVLPMAPYIAFKKGNALHIKEHLDGF